MTAQKFSAKGTKHRYFDFVLQQNWPTLVTNSILLVLINVLILSLALTDNLSSYYMDVKFETKLLQMLEDYKAINVVIVSFLAVVWGCTTMPYLNNKVCVNFYHSLPLTREMHYLHEVGCKVLLFFIPMAGASFFGYLTTGMITGEFGIAVAIVFFEIFLLSTVYFLLFYSIMVFCASFTGTGFARLFSAGLIVFMPYLLSCCLYLILDFDARFADYTWIEQFGVQTLLPYRAIMVTTNENDVTFAAIVWELAFTLFSALVFFALGALIYKRRKSELSGTPVLSKIAGGIMKYSVMFVAATLVAIAMDDMAGGLVGVVIGCVAGALLSMMLMNTILTKSAKNMFRGMPGFAATCGVFALLFTVFGLNMLGFDTYVPPANLVRSIEVEIYNNGNIELVLQDDAEIARITEIVDEYLQSGYEQEIHDREQAYSTKLQDVYFDEKTWEQIIVDEAQGMMRERYTVRVSFQTVGGVRFDKRYSTYTDGEQYELLTILANSEGFADAFFGDENTIVGAGRIHFTSVDLGSIYDGITQKESQSIWANMRASYNGIEYFNRPLLATIYLNGTPMYSMPFFEATDIAIEAYLDSLSSIWVVNTKTGAMTKYDAYADMEAILSVGITSADSISGWCPKDDTYVFFGFIGDETDYRYISAWFLKDQVPSLPDMP